MEVDRVGAKDEGLAHQVKLNVLDTSGRCLVTWGVHNDHSTVLVVSGRLRVSLILDVSCQQADFSSHLDLLATEFRLTSIVFVEQWLSEGNHRVCVSVADRCNGALLCISSIEIGRGDYNLLANLPIKRVTCHVVQSDLGGALFRSCFQVRPCDWSMDSVHFEGTIVDADHFVAKDWQVGVVL